jgi:hypothetical protein
LDFYVNRAITPGEEANRLPFHGSTLVISIIYIGINSNTDKMILVKKIKKMKKQSGMAAFYFAAYCFLKDQFYMTYK